MRRRLNIARWLCVWSTAVVLAAGAIAHAAQSLRIVPILHDKEVLVSFTVADGYSDDVRDAISSGLRTTFSYDVELRMVARMWIDRTIATAVVGTSDQYDNLTRRHSLVRTVDGRVVATVTTEDETVVRQWLTTLDRFALCDTTKLDPNRDYYVRVSAQVLPSRTSLLGLANAVVGQAKFTFVP
jgi:Domain of unknown function (DUF4390)